MSNIFVFLVLQSSSGSLPKSSHFSRSFSEAKQILKNMSMNTEYVRRSNNAAGIIYAYLLV